MMPSQAESIPGSHVIKPTAGIFDLGRGHIAKTAVPFRSTLSVALMGCLLTLGCRAHPAPDDNN